jgi:pre-mRNA-splicing helicase BRR2
LLQLPGFTDDLIAQLSNVKVNDISDFMNMDDDDRDRIMQIDENEMMQLAAVCNRYPVVEMAYKLS